MKKLNDEDIQAYFLAGNSGFWKVESEEGKKTRLYTDEITDELFGITEDLSPEKCMEYVAEHIYPQERECFWDYMEELKSHESEAVYRYMHPVKGVIYIRCTGRRVSSPDNMIRLVGYHLEAGNIVHFEKEKLLEIYRQWNREQQEEFLNFCTGNKGIKILYDAFFKEILNPESAPERLEEFLSLILEQKVKILKVLPNDTVRIADESSLVIMDIVIEMEDHSIANVEVQKIGYLFAGQRSACYSADLLLRQYKRVKGEKGKTFSYRDIKKVYTIVLYEKSPREFKDFPEDYIHRFSQKSDTGVEMELLQEYVYIPLDVFRDIVHNKGIRNKLEAWLEFLSTDSPEEIAELVEAYPEFRKLYAEVYGLCLNVERVMEMFSKELQELDRNTVQYMIDEMQEEIDGKQEEINEQRRKLEEKEALILSLQEEIKQLKQEHEK